MCGYLFQYNFNKETINKKIFDKSLDLISYRGPNEKKILYENSICFGFNRLSILDLNNGSQPMMNNEKNIIILFNGEIYNYKELIQNWNLSPKTNSDTEVLLLMYEKVGEDFVKYLNGMFSFIILDKRNNIIFLCRDRFGEKPLFYYFDQKCLYVSSELKPIKNLLSKTNFNKNVLDQYLFCGYPFGNDTIYENIQSFPISSYAVLKKGDLNIKPIKYWNINFNTQIKPNKEDFRKLEFLINDSIYLRTRSDVGFCSFLSGGIDSSIITSQLARHTNNLNAFCYEFNESSYNESEYAKKLSSHLNINLNIVSNDHSRYHTLIDVVSKSDSPITDSSFLPLFFLCREASKNNKVAMGGDGGDEIFFGYETYKATLLNRYTKFFKNKYLYNFFKKKSSNNHDKLNFFFKFKKFISSKDIDDVFSHFYWRSFLDNEDFKIIHGENINDFLNYSLNNIDLLKSKNFRAFDIQTWLANNILVKSDRASMLNSLELRSPFLDHRILEYVFNKNITNIFDKKKILVKLYKNNFPPNFLNRKKSGFNSPLPFLLKERWRNMVIDNIYENTNIYNYFEKSVILKIMNDYFENKNDYHFFLYSFLVLKNWMYANT